MVANIFSDFYVYSLFCTQPFHLSGEIIYLLLQLEVHPVLLRMGHHFEAVDAIEANLLYEFPAVADEVVGRCPVASAALHVAVVRLPSCRHVRPRMVVAAVALFKALYLSSTDTSEASVGHNITQTYVRTEHLVELLGEVNRLPAC